MMKHNMLMMKACTHCELIPFPLQVVKGSEFLEVLHSLPKIKSYLFSLYDTHYAEFFRCLGMWCETNFNLLQHRTSFNCHAPGKFSMLSLLVKDIDE